MSSEIRFSEVFQEQNERIKTVKKIFLYQYKIKIDLRINRHFFQYSNNTLEIFVIEIHLLKKIF